jgi:glutamate/tyrosine decarboxylase-like PLP-dependent enzyme
MKLINKIRKLGLMDGLVKPVLSVIIAGARAVPLAKGLVESEVQKEVDKIESDLLGEGDENANISLPSKAMTHKDIIAELTDLKATEGADGNAKKWCGIYHKLGASELTAVQAEAWSMFNNSNSLYPGVFPSIRKFEAEIVSMTVSMLHGEKTGAVGLLSSGGTESILIAMFGYREWALQRGITNAEIICSHTAHPAVDKACHYFGLKLVKILARSNDHKLDPADVRAAINSNTIAIYASAPSFPHGVIDPVGELAALAKEKNIGCHVDNCLGGFYLSYLRRCGVYTEDFDFSVEGVTTMSIDVHKYGFASKGCSVVAFANNDIRRLTYIPTTNGTTLYITPTLQGSRSGATIASAWATLMHMGDEGYEKVSRLLIDLIEWFPSAAFDPNLYNY